MWGPSFLPSLALDQKMRSAALYCLDKQAHYEEDFASDEEILLKSITEHGCGDKANGAGNIPTYE